MCLVCVAVDEVVVVTYWDGCSVGSFVVEEDRTSMHVVTIIFVLRCLFLYRDAVSKLWLTFVSSRIEN